MSKFGGLLQFSQGVSPVSKPKHSLLHRFNMLFLSTMLIFTLLLVAAMVIINLRLRNFAFNAIRDSLRFYDNRLDVELDQDIMYLIDSCSSSVNFLCSAAIFLLPKGLISFILKLLISIIIPPITILPSLESLQCQALHFHLKLTVILLIHSD